MKLLQMLTFQTLGQFYDSKLFHRVMKNQFKSALTSLLILKSATMLKIA